MKSKGRTRVAISYSTVNTEEFAGLFLFLGSQSLGELYQEALSKDILLKERCDPRVNYLGWSHSHSVYTMLVSRSVGHVAPLGRMRMKSRLFTILNSATLQRVFVSAG